MTQVTAYVKSGHVKLLQEAMKNYPFRFIFNPYPTKRSDPVNSKWCIGIDYGQATAEQVQEFECYWARLETQIVETYRKPSKLKWLSTLLSGVLKNGN